MGDREGRPYGEAETGGVEPRPYGGLQEVRGERYPPVTALPCQPPLGKGAKGTGDADCHSQCAHWLRNDRGFYKGCGTESTGGQRRPPLRNLQGVLTDGASGKSAKRRQWRKKRADFEEVPRLAGTTVAVSRLARRWATAAPYGWVASSAAEWATARVAPTGCNTGCGGA